MLKKILFIVNASLLVVASALAQTGEIEFQENSIDFGLINEGVQAEHEFIFKNTGSAPVVISNVRASCGCTTPNWTREPVAPGGTGIIKASFNSQGRPGVFNKSITITSNAVESNKVIFIKGVVETGSEKPEYTADELKKSPEHKIDKNEYNFGKIERGQKVVREFTVKNTGKNPLSISKAQSACNCIKYTLTPEVLEHNKSGKLEIVYSPYQDGQNRDIITLTTNDLKNPTIQISLVAEVVESLTNQSPVKETNPVPFK
jgi:hypothetical protein